MARPTPLKRAIFESGRTQRSVAAAVELDESAFSRIVNGLHCDDRTRNAIARELGRSTDELFPPQPAPTDREAA